MTEDEAKTKWCPMVRYVSTRGEGINRWISEDDAQPSPDMAKCLGSGCMMWREDRLRGGAMLGVGAEVIGGHCGLAGPVS